MEKKTEKCCGVCCWFCFEQTDGEGQCPTGDGCWTFTHCGVDPCNSFVSREEMRHYMAVLLQAKRWSGNQLTVVKPDTKDFLEAIDFAVKHMKVFSKL